MKEKLYNLLPHFLQNLMVVLYNYKAYKIRYGGSYKMYREEKKRNRNLSLKELEKYQAERYKKLIEFAIQHSAYYQKSLGSITGATDIAHINQLPIVNKETLRQNISSIVVQTTEKLEKSKTGGTTGKSLEVQNFARNSQERFAFLDDFRSRFGYELGKKTAWFSGKNLLTAKDINKIVFGKQIFYTTFVIILLFILKKII